MFSHRCERPCRHAVVFAEVLAVPAVSPQVAALIESYATDLVPAELPGTLHRFRHPHLRAAAAPAVLRCSSRASLIFLCGQRLRRRRQR